MLALVNGKLLTMTHGTIERGTVLIDGGKIVAAGADVAVPAGAEVVDCAGKYVTPGLIDANSKLGIHNDGFGSIGYDDDEKTTPIAPQLRAIDAVWPGDIALAECVKAGITAVSTGPATSGVINGQCAVIKTRGNEVDEMIVKAPAGLRLSITGTRGGASPRDRAQDVYMLRQELQRAKEGLAKQQQAAAKAAEKGEPYEPERNLKQEVLASLLSGELAARVHVNLNHDITNAIELAQEWGLKLILEDAAEANLMAREIAAAGVPVICGPLVVNRAGERKHLSLKTPGVLARAGVKVAICSGFPETPGRYLFASAALAASEGMDIDEALKSITINAAEILGVADRLGSLDAGKDADVVVWSDHPFEITGRVECVYMDGALVAHNCSCGCSCGCQTGKEAK